MRLRPEHDTRLVPAPGLRRPRIPSFAPTMSNSKTPERSAWPPLPCPQTRFAGPLCPAPPNRAKREEKYIDRTGNPQRRNLLRYESRLLLEAIGAVGHPRAVSGAVYRASNRPCPAPKPAESRKKVRPRHGRSGAVPDLAVEPKIQGRIPYNPVTIGTHTSNPRFSRPALRSPHSRPSSCSLATSSGGMSATPSGSASKSTGAPSGAK